MDETSMKRTMATATRTAAVSGELVEDRVKKSVTPECVLSRESERHIGDLRFSPASQSGPSFLRDLFGLPSPSTRAACSEAVRSGDLAGCSSY